MISLHNQVIKNNLNNSQHTCIFVHNTANIALFILVLLLVLPQLMCPDYLNKHLPKYQRCSYVLYKFLFTTNVFLALNFARKLFGFIILFPSFKSAIVKNSKEENPYKEKRYLHEEQVKEVEQGRQWQGM